MNKINTEIASGFVPINGASIYYERTGEGHPVVLVHGLGLDCRMWDCQFGEFAKKFDILRYDLRGFGKSSIPTDEPYSHHNDLRALLSYFGISCATLIGLSMGGRVVIDFALTFPGLTSSLILVDTALHGYTFKTFTLEKVIASAKGSGPDSAQKEWLGHDLFKPANRTPSVANALEEIISAYSGWHWLHKNPWTPLYPPSMEQLDKIKVPVLIIVGELDLSDFHEIAELLLEKISTSQKIVIPNAGHMCNMENPEEFNKICLYFLNQFM